MLGFFKIINLIPAIRALIAEESLLPKNSHNKIPFALAQGISFSYVSVYIVAYGV